MSDTRDRLKALAQLSPITVTLADGRQIAVPDAAHVLLHPSHPKMMILAARGGGFTTIDPADVSDVAPAGPPHTTGSEHDSWSHDLELPLAAFEDLSENEDGSRLYAALDVYGATHHMELLRVMTDEDGRQVPLDGPSIENWDNLQQLYSEDTYRTFELPGREGRWIAFLHPSED